ncbi:MAG: hypothetical protein ABJB73_00805, partial [Candidatus Nitrosocosmicus sp.]
TRSPVLLDNKYTSIRIAAFKTDLKLAKEIKRRACYDASIGVMPNVTQIAKLLKRKDENAGREIFELLNDKEYLDSAADTTQKREEIANKKITIMESKLGKLGEFSLCATDLDKLLKGNKKSFWDKFWWIPAVRNPQFGSEADVAKRIKRHDSLLAETTGNESLSLPAQIEKKATIINQYKIFNEKVSYRVYANWVLILNLVYPHPPHNLDSSFNPNSYKNYHALYKTIYELSHYFKLINQIKDKDVHLHFIIRSRFYNIKYRNLKGEIILVNYGDKIISALFEMKSNESNLMLRPLKDEIDKIQEITIPQLYFKIRELNVIICYLLSGFKKKNSELPNDLENVLKPYKKVKNSDNDIDWRTSFSLETNLFPGKYADIWNIQPSNLEIEELITYHRKITSTLSDLTESNDNTTDKVALQVEATNNLVINTYLFDYKLPDTDKLNGAIKSNIIDIPSRSLYHMMIWWLFTVQNGLLLFSMIQYFTKNDHFPTSNGRLRPYFASKDNLITPILNTDVEKINKITKLREKLYGTTGTFKNIEVLKNAYNQRSNKTYQYQGTDITYLLNYLMFEYQDTDKPIFYVATIGDEGWFDNNLKQMLDQTTENLPTLAVYNLGNYHWVSFVLLRNKNGITVLYKDSFGSKNEQLKKRIVSILGTPIIFKYNTSKEQFGSSLDCGIFSIKNIRIMAENILKNKENFVSGFKYFKGFCNAEIAEQCREHDFAIQYVVSQASVIIRDKHNKESKMDIPYLLNQLHVPYGKQEYESTVKEVCTIVRTNVIGITLYRESEEELKIERKRIESKLLGLETGRQEPKKPINTD